MLEIYFFTFLFCLGTIVYAFVVYFNCVNENERHFILLLLTIPIIGLILVL